jgi:hypothetical protein
MRCRKSWLGRSGSAKYSAIRPVYRAQERPRQKLILKTAKPAPQTQISQDMAPQGGRKSQIDCRPGLSSSILTACARIWVGSIWSNGHDFARHTR